MFRNALRRFSPFLRGHLDYPHDGDTVEHLLCLKGWVA